MLASSVDNANNMGYSMHSRTRYITRFSKRRGDLCNDIRMIAGSHKAWYQRGKCDFEMSNQDISALEEKTEETSSSLNELALS